MSTPQQPEPQPQMVGFRLSPVQWSRLEAAAQERSISLSDFAKGCVIATLAGGEAGEVYRTLGYFQALAEVLALIDRGVKRREFVPRLRARLEAAGLASNEGEKEEVVQTGHVDRGADEGDGRTGGFGTSPQGISPPMDVPKADRGASSLSPSAAEVVAPQPETTPPASVPVGRGWAEQWEVLKAMEPGERVKRTNELRAGRPLPPEGFAGWVLEKKIDWLQKEWPL